MVIPDGPLKQEWINVRCPLDSSSPHRLRPRETSLGELTDKALELATTCPGSPSGPGTVSGLPWPGSFLHGLWVPCSPHALCPYTRTQPSMCDGRLRVPTSFLAATLCGMGSYFPNQRSNLCFLQWKSRILTTGLPGKSPRHQPLRNVLSPGPTPAKPAPHPAYS